MEEIKNIIRRIVQATGLYFDYLLFRENYFPSKLQKQEREDIELRKAFYSQFISKDNLCFDIGANVGNRTSVFAALKAKVIAVEPQKYCCQQNVCGES